MISNNNDGETTNVIATSSNAGGARAGARAGNLSPVPDGREELILLGTTKQQSAGRMF